MLARLALILLLLAALPVRSQVEPGATGGDIILDNDTQMLTPPPVSGVPYPNMATSDTLPNYFSAAVTAKGGYISNVLPSETSQPVDDGTYSVYPTITLARSTSRQQVTATYSPSFVFYKSTSVLDTVNHGASLTFQDRLSPHVTFNVEDFFYRTSDVFNQSFVFSEGGVTGSTQTPATVVIAPFEQQLSNLAHAFLTYQFGRDGMIGGGGSFQINNYSAPSITTGLGNSHETGAWAFYNRRLTRFQYAGFAYQYTRTIAQISTEQTDTQIDSLLPFYTFYFKQAISASVSGGVQRVNFTSASFAPLNKWSPEAVASVGYQGSRGHLAASYSYAVSSGQGLLGAFNTKSASLAGGWSVNRNWNANLSVVYADTSSITPQIANYPGGTVIAGQASLAHSFTESFVVAVGYERLHEDYSNIPIIAANPDSNEVYGRITYEFRKPLGK